MRPYCCLIYHRQWSSPSCPQFPQRYLSCLHSLISWECTPCTACACLGVALLAPELPPHPCVRAAEAFAQQTEAVRQLSQQVQRGLARHLTSCAAHVAAPEGCLGFLQHLLSQLSAQLAETAQAGPAVLQGRAEAVLRLEALLESLRGVTQVWCT